MLPASMVIYDLHLEGILVLGGWRYVWEESGHLYVIICGGTLMLEWPVDN